MCYCYLLGLQILTRMDVIFYCFIRFFLLFVIPIRSCKPSLVARGLGEDELGVRLPLISFDARSGSAEGVFISNLLQRDEALMALCFPSAGAP